MNPIPHLKVSGKAHELTLRLFEQTRGRSWSHEPVLRERLQRSALTVALHIMRGARDQNRFSFTRALDAALLALRELAYMLAVARDLALLTSSTYAMLEARTAELDRMLVGLRHKVRSSGMSPRAPGRAAPPRGRAAAGVAGASGQPRRVDGPPQRLPPNAGAPLGIG